MSKIRIHIGGLPLRCTSTEVSDLLSRTASREIKANVAVDGLTGLQRPYAFANVFFRVGSVASDEEDADSVVKRITKSLNGCRWKGSKLVVDIARPDPAVTQQKTVEEKVLNVIAAGSDGASPVSKCDVPCGHTKLAKLGLPSRVLRIQRKRGDRIIFVDPEPSDIFLRDSVQRTNVPRKRVKVHRATRCTTFQDIVTSGDGPSKVPGEASAMGSDVVGGGEDGSILPDMEESRQADNFPPQKKAALESDEDIGNILKKEQEQNLSLLHHMRGMEFAKPGRSDGPARMEERQTSVLNSFVPTERFVPMDTSLDQEVEQALPLASSSPLDTSESVVPDQHLGRYCVQQEPALTDIFRHQFGASGRSREEETEAKGFKISSMFAMDGGEESSPEESHHPSNNPNLNQTAVDNDPNPTVTNDDILPSYVNDGVLWADLEQLMSEASSFVRTDPREVIEEKWRVMRSEIMSNMKRKRRVAKDRKDYYLNRDKDRLIG